MARPLRLLVCRLHHGCSSRSLARLFKLRQSTYSHSTYSHSIGTYLSATPRVLLKISRHIIAAVVIFTTMGATHHQHAYAKGSTQTTRIICSGLAYTVFTLPILRPSLIQFHLRRWGYSCACILAPVFQCMYLICFAAIGYRGCYTHLSSAGTARSDCII